MVSKQKILIVDDDNNIAELISLYLTKECYDTKIVNDGEEALRAFEQYNPNLILLDLMLPGIDGYQVCREIRTKSNVPIILPMDIVTIVIDNLEKVGIGVVLFLGAYLSNVCLGAWRNVKIEGYDFDWKLIGQSLIKFVVLGVGISLLSVVVSTLPIYMAYVGIAIADDTMQVLDSIVIITAFVLATAKYVKDAYEKLKDILGA